ncbi:MAG: DNA-3-methyladenine glycosylase family protein [Ilumatobacteraceae bacterium]
MTTRLPTPVLRPVSARVPVALPFAGGPLFSFLAARAVAGVEAVVRADDAALTYRRALRLGNGVGAVAVTWRPGADRLECSVWLGSDDDAAGAIHAVRRLFDVDADPERIDGHLGSDRVLRPLVARRPGLRSPGHPDAAELVVRAIVGQQVSVAGARTVLSRLAEQHGEPSAAPVAGVTRLFPSPSALAALAPSDLPMPAVRGRALIECCRLLATGELVLQQGGDIAAATRRLQRVPGIGAWTAGYVAMRVLGDPDVFLPTDVGVRNALHAVGADVSPRAAAVRAMEWQPWRSYAMHHLWSSL